MALGKQGEMAMRTGHGSLYCMVCHRLQTLMTL